MQLCDDMPYNYNKGYIFLPLDDTALQNLQESIEIRNMRLLKKSKFHVSLVCVKNIESVQEGIGDRIIELFCNFAQKHPFSFQGYTGVFRYVVDKSGERRSLVAMCKLSNLDVFFDHVNRELGLSIPYQPTHVTLYTLKQDQGIGLNSQEDIQKMTEDVTSELSKDFIDEITKS
ncbi:MAG: hypothetical protein LRY41_01415 [Candidatus Pacebacteria bacterium]|nr:hypothetical protein [Candidatus Paceibacterota bacterium]MCD8507888.1 hypothetical protein [Candidatus Paceibacterota bacterium]MCD8527971.1 hypothetical protein [Candidatus Paceibacterota bacterium]MCD8563544.1 hypothetical protein [Candidatus Paceibacterota bacterium]